VTRNRGMSLAVTRRTVAPYSPDEQVAHSRPVPRAPAPAQLPQVTTAALERFACISERCEDNCCRDWAVPLDQHSLDRMKGLMSRTAEGRERLHRLVVIGRPAPHAPGRAHIQMDEHGACPMLEPDSKCGVHAAFGEEALTTACSIFPRTAVAVGDRLEVGASLGCPEVGRLVLLAEDRERSRLRPAGKPMLARPYVGNSVSGDPTDAFARHFLEVRGLLLHLLAQDRFSLPARLVAAAHFAERVQPFFFAGTTEFEGPRDGFARRRLRAEIEEATSAELLSGLERDVAGLQVPGDQTAAMVATLLLERKRLPHSPRFAELLRQGFSSLQEEALGHPARADESVTAGQLWRVYQARRSALEDRLDARSARVFANYCEHFLVRHPYTGSGSLLEYLYKLLVQLAAIRFLTLAHPDIAAMLDAPPAEADRATFDRVVVHVVQTFTKAIGHQVAFLDVAFQAARDSGGFTFGRLLVLAKFI
jgi:lysine-N-methylase